MSQVAAQTTAVGALASWANGVASKVDSTTAGSAEEQQSAAKTTADVVDISSEAWAFYRATPVSDDSNLELAENSTTIKTPVLETVAETETSERVSKHTDLTAWIFGLSEMSDTSSTDTDHDSAIRRIRQMHAIVQAEEERLDTKVGAILKQLGVELAEDETLEIKIDMEDRRIVVEGIADEKTAARIEEALNDAPKLVDEMLVQWARKNVCDQQLTRGEHLKEEDFTPLAEVDSRVWEILYDDLLQREAGASLDAITFDSDGNLATDNSELAALLSEEWALSSGIEGVLTTEHDEPLEVSFAFKNDTLIDQEALGEEDLGYRIDEFQNGIEMIWFEYCVDPILEMGPASIDEFKVTLGSFGRFHGVEATADESLTSDEKEMIESWFDGTWANEISPWRMQKLSDAADGDSSARNELLGKLAESGSQRAADMLSENDGELTPQEWQQLNTEIHTAVMESQQRRAEMNELRQDVVMHDILRLHEFEDGDTDEYAHEVEFTFDYRGESSYVVLSEEADAAIQQEISGMTEAVAEGLDDYFRGEGIDTSDGLFVQFDETGKITCDLADGDPHKQDVQKAVDKLNEAIEQGVPIGTLGETFGMLLEVRDLLADLHDPVNNAQGYVVGGRPGQELGLNIALGEGVNVRVPLGRKS